MNRRQLEALALLEKIRGSDNLPDKQLKFSTDYINRGALERERKLAYEAERAVLADHAIRKRQLRDYPEWTALTLLKARPGGDDGSRWRSAVGRLEKAPAPAAGWNAEAQRAWEAGRQHPAMRCADQRAWEAGRQRASRFEDERRLDMPPNQRAERARDQGLPVPPQHLTQGQRIEWERDHGLRGKGHVIGDRVKLSLE